MPGIPLTNITMLNKHNSCEIESIFVNMTDAEQFSRKIRNLAREQGLNEASFLFALAAQAGISLGLLGILVVDENVRKFCEDVTNFALEVAIEEDKDKVPLSPVAAKHR